MELGGSAGPFLAGFEKLLDGVDQGAGSEGDVDLILRDSEGGRGGGGPLMHVGETGDRGELRGRDFRERGLHGVAVWDSGDGRCEPLPQEECRQQKSAKMFGGSPGAKAR